MKVVHLTSVHSPFDVRIFHKECRSLARSGYDVVLVAPHTHDETVDGVRIKAVAKGSHRLSRMTRIVSAIYHKAVMEHADIYHFHDPELIGAGLMLAARGKKVIYDIHEDCPADILDKHYLPTKVRRPLSWLAKHVEDFSAPRFSALITATNAIARRFVRFKNTVIIHNYPLSEEIYAKSDFQSYERCSSVAYVGGITPYRGIREAIQAMQTLAPDLNAALELAGPYSPQSFRAQLIQLPGWTHVREWGILTRAEVRSLLGRVTLGLLLYHGVANNITAEPNKLFEYMAAGIPVIASNFPVWRQLIREVDCGVLVDPSDVDAIADALNFFLTHSNEARAMGERGRRAVLQRFNWETDRCKLTQLYSALLGSTNIEAAVRT